MSWLRFKSVHASSTRGERRSTNPQSVLGVVDRQRPRLTVIAWWAKMARERRKSAEFCGFEPLTSAIARTRRDSSGTLGRFEPT